METKPVPKNELEMEKTADVEPMERQKLRQTKSCPSGHSRAIRPQQQQNGTLMKKSEIAMLREEQASEKGKMSCGCRNLKLSRAYSDAEKREGAATK